MLDITVYPECLDCPYPDFWIDITEISVINEPIPIRNQQIRCDSESVCKRIAGKKIDLDTCIEGNKHETRILEVMKPNAKRKMVKAVCERCKQESDWHYSDKAAKRELENKECKCE